MMFNLFSLFKKKPPEIYYEIGSESENFISIYFNKPINLSNLEELLDCGLIPCFGGKYDFGCNLFMGFKKLPNYDKSKLQDLLIEWLNNG